MNCWSGVEERERERQKRELFKYSKNVGAE
jgi:hypothetical protein